MIRLQPPFDCCPNIITVYCDTRYLRWLPEPDDVADPQDGTVYAIYKCPTDPAKLRVLKTALALCGINIRGKL